MMDSVDGGHGVAEFATKIEEETEQIPKRWFQIDHSYLVNSHSDKDQETFCASLASLLI
jgi:hypothetical protein